MPPASGWHKQAQQPGKLLNYAGPARFLLQLRFNKQLKKQRNGRPVSYTTAQLQLLAVR
jgi:hypothetical protein